MHRNVYVTDAQHLLHVWALHECHHQGVFTVVMIYDMVWYDISVNCNWVDTRWQ